MATEADSAGTRKECFLIASIVTDGALFGVPETQFRRVAALPHTLASVQDAWEFVRAISPRPRVRLADTGPSGEVLNLYSRSVPLSQPAPQRPWAMYLADARGVYRVLGFDFDAKHEGAPTAQEQSLRLVEMLFLMGIEGVLEAESGPGGGRHVFVNVVEGMSAAEVAELAHRLQQAGFSTLDIGMLCNPRTGAIRPPGAPHRDGGASRVIFGTLDAFFAAEGNAAALREMIDHLPAVESATTVPSVTLDLEGTRLNVPKTPLTTHATMLLNTPLRLSDDASRVAWNLCLAAARAGWTLQELWTLVPTAPGLERYRTLRQATGRVPRPGTGTQSGAAALQRDWQRAIAFASRTPTHRVDADRQVRAPGRLERVTGAVVAAASTVQQRIEASPGRWSRPGGAADRRVLEMVLLQTLRAQQLDVEADVRTLADLAGVGRSTVARALVRLAEDGWLRQVAPGLGTRGATWTVDADGTFHRQATTGGTQNTIPYPRPLEGLLEARKGYIKELELRRSRFAHDIFTGRGSPFSLGDGNLFASMLEGVPVEALVDDCGRAARVLARFEAHDLSVDPLRPASVAELDRAAVLLGVAGRLEARRGLYRIERELWRWWQHEQSQGDQDSHRVSDAEWAEAMQMFDAELTVPPGRGGRSQRSEPYRGQVVLDGFSAATRFPRRSDDGKLDYSVARAAVLLGSGWKRPVPAVTGE